jgi:hypothetical protein
VIPSKQFFFFHLLNKQRRVGGSGALVGWTKVDAVIEPSGKISEKARDDCSLPRKKYTTQPTRVHSRGAMSVSVCAQSALIRPRTYSNTRFSFRRTACLRGDALVSSNGRSKKVQVTTPPRHKYLSIRAAQRYAA